MTKHFGAALAAVAITGVLSGCAGGASTPPAASSTAASSAASTPASTSASAAGTTAGSAADLKTAATTAGQAVVDAKGMSVYVFTKDTKDSGTSACTGSCIATWPPVLSSSGTPAADGVTGKIGTITTPDGKTQLTINGMPVYHFAKDRAPGDTTGEGVGGVWFLISPSGETITAAAGGGY